MKYKSVYLEDTENDKYKQWQLPYKDDWTAAKESTAVT